MTHQNYEEIGKKIFGEKCPKDWGKDRPWKVERYVMPKTKSCHHSRTAYRIVTKSGFRINLTWRVFQTFVDLANEAE